MWHHPLITFTDAYQTFTGFVNVVRNIFYDVMFTQYCIYFFDINTTDVTSFRFNGKSFRNLCTWSKLTPSCCQNNPSPVHTFCLVFTPTFDIVTTMVWLSWQRIKESQYFKQHKYITVADTTTHGIRLFHMYLEGWSLCRIQRKLPYVHSLFVYHYHQEIMGMDTIIVSMWAIDWYNFVFKTSTYNGRVHPVLYA